MNCGADGDLLLEDGARDDATPQPELNGVKERVQKIAALKFQMFWPYMVLWVFNKSQRFPKLLCHDQDPYRFDGPDPPFRDAKRSFSQIFSTLKRWPFLSASISL